MIKSVLFVHGTGVRKASYEFSAASIARGLHEVDPAIRLETCLWGDQHGARLNLDGASIPDFSPKAAATPSKDQTIALWELLARDPLFELRELAATGMAGLEPPAEKQKKATLLTRLRELSSDTVVVECLQTLMPRLRWQETILTLGETAALVTQWQAAIALVSAAPALKELLASTHKVDTTLRLGIARAVIAALQSERAETGMPAVHGQARDELVEVCLDRLGGRELGGVKDWVSSRLLGLGLKWATAKARRERDALFSVAAPVSGDVLLYQARGARIRAFIERRIAECGDNVAIFAHSLGGIACVDLLVERPLPQVGLLVTVGSQAPFLYEIDALCSLPFGRPLPAHFPRRWLNFYDCNDVLSYAAARVFPGRAVDHEITSGQPFPDSHSAYWTVPALWDELSLQLGQAP